MQVYDISDRPVDDGIRDPFRWARFNGAKFLFGVLVFAWIAVLAAGRDPDARTRGAAIDVGGHVIGAAMRTGEAHEASSSP